MRPFNSQFINFDGISKFVSYYAAFSGREDVAKAAAGIRHDIQLLVRESFAMPTILLYNLTTTQFEAQLKNPMYARRAALGLFGIIQTSGMLYQQFIIEQQSRLSPDDLRGMQQQMTPGGPHTSNINTLNELQYDLKQKLGIK